MTTEPQILTDEQIAQTLNDVGVTEYADVPLRYDLEIAHAIKQAILQSPEIQALRKDAERYRAIRAASGSDDGVFCGAVFDYACENFTNPGRPTADEYDGAIDAAMREQKP